MPSTEPGVDALFAEVLAAGEDIRRLRELLTRHDPGDAVLHELVRRAVPVRLLELITVTAPWMERPRVLGAVALNPRTPRSLAQRLLPSLYWRDLAEVAASPRLGGALHAGAESLLKERLPDLRLGERITLAKIATPSLLRLLLADADPKVIGAALSNPRLREEDLLLVLREKTASRSLLEETASSSRWREQYCFPGTWPASPRPRSCLPWSRPRPSGWPTTGGPRALAAARIDTFDDGPLESASPLRAG
jgi:hypothetical protein